MTIGMGLRAIIQATIFLVVARVLGVEGYGTYVAVLALAGALGSTGGLGTHMLVVRDLARNPDTFSRTWGSTISASAASAPFLLAAYCLISWSVLPNGISPFVIGFIGLAELVFLPFTLAAIAVYQGYERMGRAALLMLAPLSLRIVATETLLLLVYLLPIKQPLEAWCVLYSTAALCTALYSVGCAFHLMFPLIYDQIVR